MRPPRALLVAAALVALAVLLAPVMPPWPARVSVEVRGDLPSWQLFFDRGRGFVESDSAWASPGAADERGWRRLEFVLPRLSLRALRLDPPGAAAETRLGAVCVEAELPWQRRACVPAARWRELFVALQHLQVVESGADEVVLRHAGPDPYLVGGVASAALVQAARGPRRLEVLPLLAAWVVLLMVCRRLRPGRVGTIAAVCGGLAAAIVWSLPAWPARVWIDLRAESRSTWDLYLYAPDDPDPLFVERATPTWPGADGWRRLTFGLPARRAMALRFDPPDEGERVVVRRLCLSALGVLPPRCFEAEELARAFPHRHDLDARLAGGLLELDPAGLDPYLWSDFGHRELLAPLRVGGGQVALAGVATAGLVLAAVAAGGARLRRSGRVLLLTLNLTVVPVAGVEILLWFVEPWLPGVWSLYDPDVGFRAKPLASRANRLGFPDHDYPAEKPHGGFRIVVLGDSFGWVGRGRWNYTDLLEASLARRFGAGRVEVINVAIPAIGPPQQRAVLRKWGLGYRPDLVLLATYLGNDVLDSDPARRRFFVGDQPVERDASDPPAVLLGRPLLPVSRLVLATKGRFRLWGRIQDEPQAGPFLLSHQQYVAAERSLVLPWYRPLRAKYAAAFAHFDASIEAIAADTRDTGASFGLIALPAAWSADPRRADAILSTVHAQREDFDLAGGHARLVAVAARLQAPLLDLLPAFAEAVAGGEELYLVDDSHWNRAGNARAAATIEPWLIEQWPQVLAAR